MRCSSRSTLLKTIIPEGLKSRIRSEVELALDQIEKNSNAIELALNGSDIERINRVERSLLSLIWRAVMTCMAI